MNNLTHEDFEKYYDSALLYVNSNCDCKSYRESEDKVLGVMEAMKDADGKDPFNQAIEQAKSELKARYITTKVAMRAMEIYCQLRKQGK